MKVDILMEEKIDVSFYDEDQKTGLMYSCISNNIKLCKKIIENQTFKGIDNADKQNKTALHHAVENNNFEIVKLLIENKSKLELRDSMDQTAISISISNSNKKIFDFLLSNLSVDLLPSLEPSLLLASKQDKFYYCQELLEKGFFF